MDYELPQILNDEHAACLDRCLASIPGTAKLIDALKKCGFDCGASEDINNQQLKAATTLKATFFPNRS